MPMHLSTDTPPDVQWTAPARLRDNSELARFQRWLADRGEIDDPDIAYLDLWRWSTGHPGSFWSAWARFEEVRLTGEPAGPVAPVTMPGGGWFPGREVNHAEHLLRPGPDPAVVAVAEDGTETVVTRAELRGLVGALATTLRDLGVERGDRVSAVLPNRLEAVVGLLACSSIGAVWSLCSPEFGVTAMLSRFAQLRPVVLIAADTYSHAGREHRRTAEIAAIVAGLPDLRAVVHVGPAGPLPVHVVAWNDAVAARCEPAFTRLPFDHPLWVLFSSGTTGVPKGIVHGLGGVLLEHLKVLRLHSDLHPSDVLLNVGSTGWVVWNTLVSGLAVGATIVLLDGSPVHPRPDRVWDVAERHRVTVLGVGAGFVHACAKEPTLPREAHDLSALRTLQVTGSPLSPEGFRWIPRGLGAHVWPASMSGGTDVASIFVGGTPTLPVRTGRIQAPALGVAVAAWDDTGSPVVGRRGELVVTTPMPSMPLHFWDDPDGERLNGSYFSTWPGVWRHGDVVEFDADGSCVIHGRSDATLNRRGVRMGSADIYQAVEALPEVLEALVVGIETGAEDYWMPLFVVLADGVDAAAARVRIVAAIRDALSPRHVPDDVIAVRAIPHTRTGKKLEIPVRRVLQGAAPGDVVDLGAVDDPDLLVEFAAMARTQ